MLLFHGKGRKAICYKLGSQELARLINVCRGSRALSNVSPALLTSASAMSHILSQRKSGNACEDVDTVILSIVALRLPERELLESGVHAVQGRSGHGVDMCNSHKHKARTPLGCQAF